MKRLLAWMVSIMLCLSLFPSAVFAGSITTDMAAMPETFSETDNLRFDGELQHIEYVSGEPVRDEVTIHISSKERTERLLITALYDASGRMIRSESRTINLYIGDNSISVTGLLIESGSSVKAFLMEGIDTMIPCCQAGVLNIYPVAGLQKVDGVTVSLVNGSSLAVEWEPVADARGYIVFENGIQIGIVADGYTNHFIADSVSFGSTYSYTVQAFSSLKDKTIIYGEVSNEASYQMPGVFAIHATGMQSALVGQSIRFETSTSNAVGNVKYYFTMYKDDVVIAVSESESEDAYTFTPNLPGIYTLYVEASDSLGRIAENTMTGIGISLPEFSVDSVHLDKNRMRIGETLVITADGTEDCSFVADVYLNNRKLERITGEGSLSFTTEEEGIYSLALEIRNSDTQSAYFFLDHAVVVSGRWGLQAVSVNAEEAATGSTVVFSTEITKEFGMRNTTGGVSSPLQFNYAVYKDGDLYKEVFDTSNNSLSMYLTEPGMYYCVCSVVDDYGTESAATSPTVTIVQETRLNENYNTPTHSNTLPVEELVGSSASDLRVAPGAVTISWTKQSGDSYYTLYVECRKIGLDIEEENYTGTTYTIPASDISSGYEYSVSLLRYDSSGTRLSRSNFHFSVTGVESLVFEDTPRILVPNKVQGEDCYVKYDDLTVQWTKMNYASAIEIKLQYSCGINMHEVLLTTVDGKADSYTIPKSVLVNGAYHELRIKAYDDFGNTSVNTSYFNVGEEGTVDEYNIDATTITSSFLSDGSELYSIPTYPAYEPIRLSWLDVPSAAYFSVHLFDYDNDNQETIYDLINAPAFVIDPTTLVSGHRYEVRIYSHHTAECYKRSKDGWFRAPYIGSLRLDPPKLTSMELSMDSSDPTIMTLQPLSLVWEPESAAVSYLVSLYMDDEETPDFEQTGITVTEVTIPKDGLWTNERYELNIAAVDSAGNSAFSVYYLKFVNSDLPAPALLSPVLSTDRTDFPICSLCNMPVTWNEVTGAEDYRFQLFDYYMGDWDKILDVEHIADTAYTIPKSKLYMGGKFKFRIKAVDAYGNGKWSETYYFRVGAAGFISLSSTDLLASADAGRKAFFVTSGEGWTATSSASWLSISESSGEGSQQVAVIYTENTGEFPRTASITFSNSEGGTAVYTVNQEGQSSKNSGALRITSPKQGSVLDYASFRATWKYNYTHAYYQLSLKDTVTGALVHTENNIITSYADIPIGALVYGHAYRLTVGVYDAQGNRISEGSVVFAIDGFDTQTFTEAEDQPVIAGSSNPEGNTEIRYSGITDGAEIERDNILVTWENVIDADHYWVALRDMTLFPDSIPSEEAEKIINKRVDLLKTSILSGQLIAGHEYRLWIAANRSDGSLIDGKNIYFSVKADGSGGSNEVPASLAYLNTSIDSWNPGYESSTRILEVDANTEWSIDSMPDWVTAIELDSLQEGGTKGRGNILTGTKRLFALMVATNEAMEGRSGQIVFVGDGVAKTIDVNQGAYIEEMSGVRILNPSDGYDGFIVGETVWVELEAGRYAYGCLVVTDPRGDTREFEFSGNRPVISFALPSSGSYTIMAYISDDPSYSEYHDFLSSDEITITAHTYAAWEGEMYASENLRDYFVRREGKHYEQYADPAGYKTIGIGHKLTSEELENKTYAGVTLTEAQVNELFEHDIAKAEGIVNNLMKSRGISFNQNQFDALVSFSFNLGDQFGKKNGDGTPYRINLFLQQYGADIPDWMVYNAFARFHHMDSKSGSKVDSKGLFYRRIEEANIYTKGDYTVAYNWPLPDWLKDGAYGPDVPDDWVWSGDSLVVHATELSLLAAGGARQISVEANGAWSASSDSSWISLQNAVGTGNGTVRFTAAANSDSQARSGVIQIVCGEARHSVRIIQAGTETGELDLTVAADADRVDTGVPIHVVVTANGGSGGYTYRYAVYKGGKLQQTTPSSDSANTFDYLPQSDGVYSFKVTVTSPDGSKTEAESGEVIVTARGLDLISPDSDGGKYYLGSLPEIRWTQQIGATSYQVRVRDLTTDKMVVSDPNDENGVVVKEPSFELSRYSAAFSDGHEYRAWIGAFDGNGIKLAQTQVVFSVGGTMEISFTAPSTSVVSDDDVDIIWEAVSGAAFYIMKVDGKTVDFRYSISRILPSGHLQKKKLTEGALYLVSVAAISAKGTMIAEGSLEFNYKYSTPVTDNIVINGVDIRYKAGDYYTKNGKACDENHDSVSNCIYSFKDTNYYKLETKSVEIDLNARQCKGFAKYCQAVMYGSVEASGDDYWIPSETGRSVAGKSDDNGFVNFGSWRPEEGLAKLKELLIHDSKGPRKGAGVGAHVRILRAGYDGKGNPKQWHHSIIIKAVTDDYICFADANGGSNRCQIRDCEWTWEQFLEKYGTIKKELAEAGLEVGIDYVTNYENRVTFHEKSVNYLPLKCYTLSKNVVSSYPNMNRTEVGNQINNPNGNQDLCTIYHIYDNDLVAVEYPTGSGTTVKFADLSSFFIKPGYDQKTMTVRSAVDTFRQDNLDEKFGRVEEGTSVTVVGEKKNGNVVSAYQIIYQSGGYYYLAWVERSAVN